MSIATEITRIETAKANIKTAIENKGVTVGDGRIDTYAEKIGEIPGVEEGYKQGYEIGFEDGFNSAPPNLLQYIYSPPRFEGGVFPENLRDVTFNFPFIITYTGSNHFNNTNLTGITIIAENATKVQLYYMFTNNKSLKYIDLSKCGNGVVNVVNEANNGFWGCNQLENVIGILDFSNATRTNTVFSGCSALKEVRIAPQSIKLNFHFNNSPNLSPETIQSIIDGLADLTGQTAQTITWHSAVFARMTDEQITQIVNKNWNIG